MNKLGALELSSDIFEKADIGLWAFELDEGSEPRMYADDTMLKLIGLDHQISPEETYHAWYDHIDAEHYDEVAASVEKMTAGVHAEVQYPWHHPNGEIWIVRCGGVRNFEYKKGIRIEGTHQNVTDVAHFQKAKLGTIALDRDILTKANIGLWAFELDEGSEPRMYADDAMLKLIGLDHQISPEETYHAWYDHIDPAHYGEVTKAVEQMTSGIHAEVQYPWHHPNGDIWTVRCGGVRNYAYTRGIRIEGTHQNVTALTHYEKKNLTTLLASLADNFVYVCFLDPYTGKISYYRDGSPDRKETVDYFNVDFYQVVENRNRIIVYPDDLSLADEIFSRENLISVLESGKAEEYVVRWQNGSGTDCKYMKHRLVPFADSDGVKKLVIGISDVTVMTMAEKALKERNVYLEYFLRSFQSAYVVDLNNDTYEILSMNHEFSHSFMKDGGRDAMNAFIERHIHPDDRELMMRMSDRKFTKELLEKEKEVVFTIREVYDDVEKTIRVIMIRGAENGRAAIGFIDISDEIAKEREYSHKLETAKIAAEAANQAKSTFLFNMSHDIRTPMNAIIGFTEIAEKHIDDKERVLESLEKVKMSGSHLLSLINDVLDMSRVESGKVKIEAEPICIDTTMDNLYSILNGSAEAKNLLLTSTLAPSLKHHWLYADRLCMMRVLTNIVSNSVKYTDPGGKIDLRIEELPCEKEGYARYRYTISDTGIGMSKEYLEHVFEPFTRAQSATKSGVIGTGLGMAITKSLTGLMGGTIEIESEPGVGTTVRLEFENAIAEPVDPTSAISDKAILNLNGKKILLVEDNELNREIAMEILEEEGIIIDTAEDGDIAVEKMRTATEGQYDLILMDIQMPRMNGYEATMAIRRLPNAHAANIPIFAMTANAFDEDKRNAFAAGMNGHITKPIYVPKLIETLSEVLQ